MKLHFKTNTLSYATANSKINEMLEDCGECLVGGEVVDDFSENNESYQEVCCETFGGIYYDSGALDWDEYYCVGSESTWVSFCGACSGTIDSDGDGTADECDECHNMAGDINDDHIIDVLDIVLGVNMILSAGEATDCALSDADIDGNTIVNILDIIQIINFVIGE